MNVRFHLLLLLGLLIGVVAGSPAYGQDQFPKHRVGLIPTDGLSPEVKQSSWSAVRGDEAKGGKAMAKIGLELAVLFHQYRVEGRTGVQALRDQSERRDGRNEEPVGLRRETRLPITEDGRYVRVDAVATGDPERLLEELRRVGLQNGARAENVVSGFFPIPALNEVPQIPTVRSMRIAYTRRTAGSVESEADTTHAAFQAREDLNLDGTNQKVCALSDSYNTLVSGPSASDDVQSGDLPGEGNPEGNETPVDVLDNGENGSDEGRAMLQLIHDIAPGAELGFHTAFAGKANFATGIRELAAAGCTVIVDDIGYRNQPFYQDGVVANAVDDVVDDGVPYFSSAGNSGQNSYEATFRGAGVDGVLDSGSERHDFDASGETDTKQKITVDAGGTFQVSTFQWTDPSATVSGSSGPNTDLNLALVDQDGDVLAMGDQNNISSGIPAEVNIIYENTTESSQTINLVIEKADGPDPEQIKYVYSGQGYTIEEYDTLGPTVYGHPMAEGAMAVGAAAFFNTAAYNQDADPAVLNDFSSKGGISIRFDQSGNELDSPVNRQKPNVTGTDGTSTTFFGDDLDGDGNPNFFGTSAAAPSVAAIAALILDSDPTLSPSEVYDRFESTAADVTRRLTRAEGLTIAGLSDGESTGPNGGSGVDDWSGHGFVQATQAVPPPPGVQIRFPEDPVTNVSSENEGTVELRWEVSGDEVSSVEELVIEQRYFDGEFTERDRISRVTEGTFTRAIDGLRVGEHTFRVSAVTQDGTVLQNTEQSVLIEAQQSDVAVFPNPFDERVNVSFTLQTQQDLTIEVFDVLGRKVATRRRDDLAEDDPRPVRFDGSELGSRSSGVYFIKVKGETFEETIQAVRVQ